MSVSTASPVWKKTIPTVVHLAAVILWALQAWPATQPMASAYAKVMLKVSSVTSALMAFSTSQLAAFPVSATPLAQNPAPRATSE